MKRISIFSKRYYFCDELKKGIKMSLIFVKKVLISAAAYMVANGSRICSPLDPTLFAYILVVDIVVDFVVYIAFYIVV